MKNPIEIKDLNVSFHHGKQTQLALNNISFTVPAGKTVGFIGPNGAGKTTTLHVLLGFIKPDSGTATLFGEDARSIASRKRIGLAMDGRRAPRGRYRPQLRAGR